MEEEFKCFWCHKNAIKEPVTITDISGNSKGVFFCRKCFDAKWRADQLVNKWRDSSIAP